MLTAPAGSSGEGTRGGWERLQAARQQQARRACMAARPSARVVSHPRLHDTWSWSRAPPPGAPPRPTCGRNRKQRGGAGVGSVRRRRRRCRLSGLHPTDPLPPLPSRSRAHDGQTAALLPTSAPYSERLEVLAKLLGAGARVDVADLESRGGGGAGPAGRRGQGSGVCEPAAADPPTPSPQAAVRCSRSTSNAHRLQHLGAKGGLGERVGLLPHFLRAMNG